MHELLRDRRRRTRDSSSRRLDDARGDETLNEKGKSILVAVAWPYANGPLHLGHMAGAYLPADIFARYHRAAGNRVLMVSGSDAHGTPITVRADSEGLSPVEIVNRYHTEFLSYWKTLGISFDLFTTTMTEQHRTVVHDFFTRLRDRGLIDVRSTEQYFDTEACRFLPDRYLHGICPHCDYERARGDQCENCGRTLDPQELTDPRSALTGSTPELRVTDHFFFGLSKLQQRLSDWLQTRRNWRPHVINWTRQFIHEGLQDRAITRDLEWGVQLPTDELGPGKRIYVWFEAVIGYLSASKEWAAEHGDAEAWRAWWEDPSAESYYFIGKDNIPFHTVIWPGMLLSFGALNLPTNVPANQFVTFKGSKASKSGGVGRSVLDYLNIYEPDALRYALATNLPEHQDTDLSDSELDRRINDELVATWGNLVHRVFSIAGQYTDRRVPPATRIAELDHDLLKKIDETLVQEAGLVEAVELRAALKAALAGAQAVNVYLNQREPWNTARSDPELTATTLNVALNAINGLKIAFYPYTPFSATRLHQAFGAGQPIEQCGWRRQQLETGQLLGDVTPLFRKIDRPIGG